MTGRRRRPLVLTGGPAVGKSSTAGWIARQRPRAAYIDVDDIRQLVVSGAEATWRGSEGAAQGRLAARNAAALARNLLADGFDVVIADVVTPATAAVYHDHLSDVVFVRLAVDFAEAQRRATLRKVWLTEEEFALLHRNDTTEPPRVDATVDVTALTFPEQCAAIEGLWSRHPLRQAAISTELAP